MGPFASHVQQQANPQPQMFRVSNTASNKPGVWAPSSTNVQVHQNPDQSITLTLGAAPEETKENIAPGNQQPMFKVRKFGEQTTSADPAGKWQPAYVPPPQPQPPPSQPLQPQLEPYGQESMDQDHWNDDLDYPIKHKPVPLDLQRILHDGSGSDSPGGLDSPGFFTKQQSK